MAHSSLEKTTLRKHLRDLLNSLSPEERQQRSAAATTSLLSTPEFANARVIMLYLSMTQEVATAPLALRCSQDGKQLCVPKIFPQDRSMMAVEINSLTSNILTDKKGLREPIVGEPVPLEFIDLIIVPGLGFGLAGQRLGRGAGYYDRFLSRSGFHGITCGLAFEAQILENLPMLPHDMHLDMLITDAAIRRFAAKVVAEEKVSNLT